MTRSTGHESTLAGSMRTIPSRRVVLSSSPANLSQFAGRYVWLRSTGGDVTMLRKTQAVTAGQGFMLKDGGDPQELYVDQSDDMTLSFTGGTIEVLYDD